MLKADEIMNSNEKDNKETLKEELEKDEELSYMLKLVEAMENDKEDLIRYYEEKLKDLKEISKTK